MESMLVVVAAVSLALAAIMSTVAWRLLRDNHHRTASRAEVLIALLQDAGSAKPKDITPPAESTTPTARPAEPVSPAPAASTTPEVPRASEPPPVKKPRAVPAIVDGPLHDEAIRRDGGDTDDESSWDRAFRPRVDPPSAVATEPHEPVATSAMFESDSPRQMSMGRSLALAAAGLVILIGAGTVYALNTGRLSPFTGGDDRGDMIAASARQPLELLSLKHGTDETGAFVITGLVQNPIEGASLRDVVATVYLFDQQGRYFASGRARLDVSTLGAGEESPFVVKIPNAAAVGRYRVGFRLDDGGVVAHVDRRGQTPAGTSGDTIDDERGPSVATPAATPRRSEG
ncbi:MAG TPA: hypothetical protein VES67_06685 [Vicinamibacterales bacterium]|nr:hypothetical protein [Vicinamibacterales bacterium]